MNKISLIFSFLFLIFLSSCAPNFQYKQPTSIRELNQARTSSAKAVEVKKAPWQVWSSKTYNSYELASAETEASNASFDSAVSYYRQAMRVSKDPNVIEQARLRLAGTLLKQGHSQDALLEISKYAKLKGVNLSALRKDYALIAAWAYLEQRGVEQSLAWFNVASSSISKSSIVYKESVKGVNSLLKTLSDTELKNASSKWTQNQLFSSLIKAERKNRLLNASYSPSAHSLNKYFNTSYYQGQQVSQQASVQNFDNVKRVNTSRVSIGVLLPLSGKFAVHANKVKEGIELATLNQDVEVVFADTQGDPSIAVGEYQNLAQTSSVILGPLLVATSEAVAKESSVTGVPIISFTKKEGLTDISNTVLRLGATSSNQTQELVNFAVNSLGIRSFAVLFPGQNNVAAAFVAEFKKALNNEQVSLVAQELYEDNETSTALAAQRVIHSRPEAIFLPDRLEYCAKIIEQIKAAGLENVKFFGPALWSDPISVRGYGQLLEDAFYVSLFNENSLNQNVQNFIQTYREKFKHDPDLLAAQSYDATSYVLNAFRSNAGEDVSLLDALNRSPQFYGVTGELSLDRNGEIYRNLAVMKIIKGEPVQITRSAGLIDPSNVTAEVLTEKSLSDGTFSN